MCTGILYQLNRPCLLSNENCQQVHSFYLKKNQNMKLLSPINENVRKWILFLERNILYEHDFVFFLTEKWGWRVNKVEALSLVTQDVNTVTVKMTYSGAIAKKGHPPLKVIGQRIQGKAIVHWFKLETWEWIFAQVVLFKSSLFNF